MDRREKLYKKQIISEVIDLGHGRFTDSEIDVLYSLATHPEEYDGMCQVYRREIPSWASSGRYTRLEITTYTLRYSDHRIAIEEFVDYHDDDGEGSPSPDLFTYSTARDILRHLEKTLTHTRI